MEEQEEGSERGGRAWGGTVYGGNLGVSAASTGTLNNTGRTAELFNTVPSLAHRQRQPVRYLTAHMGLCGGWAAHGSASEMHLFILVGVVLVATEATKPQL